ncbi:hypothetical protein L6452_41999 [Arctium lappa]|uniref:Uncharacterized protein n=1 Tax=Arctium lappa TaxID=4217 RepID=A0ACB8XGI7_ARCLA|nr:hypothetical protein L6452_41999 [Arctium lappa]
MPLLFIILYLSYLPSSPAATTTGNNISIPGCPTKCGNLTVPYPFGIGSNSGCSIGPWFDITCNTSFNPPKAFLPRNLFFYTGNDRFHPVEIVDISDEHVRVKNFVATNCYSEIGEIIESISTVTGLVASFYFTLSELNKLIAVGCDDYSTIAPVSGIEGKNFSSGCVTLCNGVRDVLAGSCSDNDAAPPLIAASLLLPPPPSPSSLSAHLHDAQQIEHSKPLISLDLCCFKSAFGENCLISD